MREIAPTLVWPPLLRLPSDDVKIIYLDLNQWIYLAQAVKGSAGNKSVVGVLEACRRAVSAGSVRFVLSAAHYMELLKIRDPKQRLAIAEIMEELTGFSTLVSRIVVMELELSSMLDPVAKLPSKFPEVPLVGFGFAHSAGLQSRFRIVGPIGDRATLLHEQMGPEAFNQLFRQTTLQMERAVLRGPADDEVAELRSYGYNPEAVIAIAEDRAREERDLTQKLASEPRWRRAPLHDLVSARELIIEFKDILHRALKERGLALTDVASDREAARKLVRSMPSTEVSIAIKTAWHKNRDKRWIANDIFDIDALALAVPYCDIVVTEKACQHILLQSGLGQCMQTALLRNLHELPSAIELWQPKRRPVA